MKDSIFNRSKNIFLLIFLFVISFSANSQNTTSQDDSFWQYVRYGGGLGLSFGDGIFSATVAPSAIYDFNTQFSAGIALNYTYFNDDDFFKSTIVGGSFIGLFNPNILPEIQLSSEFEYMHVSRNFEDPIFEDDNYWQPAVFFGIGYTSDVITVGVRYNVLHDDEKSIYADALVPFVRVYF